MWAKFSQVYRRIQNDKLYFMARCRGNHRLGGQFPSGTRNRLLLNIIVGIVGAFLAGLFLTPYLGISTINQNDFSLPALMVSLLGALILLTVLSFFSRRTQETDEDFGEEVTQPIAETQAVWTRRRTRTSTRKSFRPIAETQAAADPPSFSRNRRLATFAGNVVQPIRPTRSFARAVAPI